MDAMELISYYLYPHNPHLEDRLKLLVNTVTYFLELEHCSITVSSNERQDYRVITGDPLKGAESNQGHHFFSGHGDNAAADENTLVFRQKTPIDTASHAEALESHLQKSQGKYVASSDFFTNGGLLIKFMIARGIDLGEFSIDETNFIEKSIASIKHEINSEVKKHYRSLLCNSTEKLLTQSRCGILVINKKMDVLEKSALAEDLLQEMHIYSCTGNHLSSDFPEHQVELAETMQELCANSELSHKIIRSVENRRGEKYTIAIRRNVPKPYNLSLEISFSLFIFSWREDVADLSPFFDLWQLSPAEKKALTAILQFDNIKKAALVLDLSSNTVKAQLKSAYRKLGVESKSMLFKRLNLVRKMEALLS